MSSNDNIYQRGAFRRPPLPRFHPPGQEMELTNANFAAPDADYYPEYSCDYINPEYVEPGPSSSDAAAFRNNSPGPDSMSSRVTTSIHRNASNVKVAYHPPYLDLQGHEQHAHEIANKMEQNPALMEDTPISDQLRKEALRDLPQCLTIKRSVKAKLSKSVSQKSKRNPIGWCTMCKYRFGFAYSKVQSNMEAFWSYFEPWYGSLKTIEGHFGSGYATYFRFLRWLFVVNLLVALPSFVLLSVPQILYDASGPVDRNQATRPGFQFGDIFTGTGSFEDTILFYGHYTNETIHLVDGLYFDMPAAYFSIVVILYLVYFALLTYSVATSYRKSFIETEGGLQNIYAHKIFCGWDYGIATKHAAALKSASIYHELKELLSESYRNEAVMSFWHKLKRFAVHVLVNILILAGLAGLGYGLCLLLDKFEVNRDDSKIVVAVLINIIMMVLPVLFTYLSKLEDYKNPRTALYVTMIRIFLLGFVMLSSIMVFWLSKAATLKVTNCWESKIGQELYRLMIFDFLFSVVLTTVIEVALYFFRKREKVEFDIARHTLQIIYNQGMFWMGFVFSPMLPLVVTLKMFVIWYVRYLTVRRLCKPPAKTWRAVQTSTWFFMTTFVTIMFAILIHGYIITNIPSSTNCGPFRNKANIYAIVTASIANLEGTGLGWKIVLYVTKPGVVALVVIFLCAWVYYLKEQAQAQREKVRILRDMLVWVAKDKEFLLQTFAKVSNNFPKPTPRPINDDIDARFKKYT